MQGFFALVCFAAVYSTIESHVTTDAHSIHDHKDITHDCNDHADEATMKKLELNERQFLGGKAGHGK